MTGVGACGWTVDRCGCGSCWAKLKPDQQATAATLASHVMWAATGRRYGLCEVTVLPCNPVTEPLYQTYPLAGYDVWDGPNAGGGGGIVGPVIDGGTWFNRCGAGCTCRARCEVPLDGPVHSIIEVTVDGDLVTTGYEVHDGHLLVRTDGACWPTCQVYGSEIPGFTVTYLRGEEIPPPVQTALEVLACQYAAYCSTGECRLPARLTSLSRQGVDVSVADLDNTDLGTKIRTGIPLVDDIIAADNPWGAVERRQVFSPDMPTNRVITWTAGS